MTLTKRQKFIAAATMPTYGGFATRKEVKEAKELARGHYWDEGEDYSQLCAYSLSGRREYFEYEWFSWGTKKQKIRWKKEARKAAKLWTQNKYKEAKDICNMSYENSDDK